MPTPLLQIQNLHKAFSVPVLTGVDLELPPGEVLALVGANGAGKSTLARIICGLLPADQGEMKLNDKPYHPGSKQTAESNGVHIVQQELNLIGTLSVAENLFLNRLPQKTGWIKRRQLLEKAQEALARVGLEDLDPRIPVEQLGVGQQQLIEIAAALAQHCRLLILDEPTAALTDPQIDLLFEQIERLKTEGVGIIYISHRMQELKRIANKMLVLRDGEVVLYNKADQVEIEEVLQAMAGRPLGQQSYYQPRPLGEPVLKVNNLTSLPLVHNVSFELKAGEILGIAGLVGSGRTELMRTLFGADQATGGSVNLLTNKNTKQTSRFKNPRQATRAGLAMIPEDRKEQGLLLEQSIGINVALNTLSDYSSKAGWLSRQLEETAIELACDQLHMKKESLRQPVNQLSGGNQQKGVIARWLLKKADVYLFDEPTRGIDMGSKETIYEIINQLAAEGKGIVIVSSELEELMAICDRIAVMSAGKMITDFTRDNWSQEIITSAAFAGYMETSKQMETNHVG